MELKKMKVQQEYYKENDATMRELNLNIVRVMSTIDGSLNDIMNAIRKQSKCCRIKRPSFN